MTVRTAPARIGRRRLFAGRGLLAGLAPFLVRSESAAAHAATPAPPASSLGWSDDLRAGNGKLNVVTTVAPLSSIVRNVGGDAINLRGIVPDGTNSHTVEPAPSDAAKMTAVGVAGVFLSYVLDVASGPVIVLVAALLCALTYAGVARA